MWAFSFHITCISCYNIYRTAYSALNRAPANLIEVILVDDASTKGWDFRFFTVARSVNIIGNNFRRKTFWIKQLKLKIIILISLFLEHSKKPLDDYVTRHMPRVRVIHLSERSGLIRARMAGARRAKGDVIIFLDSHSEANVNWLPPLLG